MSTTYRQISQFNEDGYGTVTVLFVVSDEYDGLFATSGQIDVGVFAVDESSKDLDTEVGTQAEDELRFGLLEQSVETTEDQDAIDFVLAAQTKTTKRYCAWFINPADIDAPEIDEVEFSGVIHPKMSAVDVVWKDEEYGSSPDPVREWDCTAGPFFSESFDSIELKKLIYGEASEGIPGLDGTFEAVQVSNRTAYFRDGSFEAKYASLVSLNAVMEQLKTNLETALDAKGFGAFNISLANSPLGFKVRSTHYEYRSGPYEWIVANAIKIYNVRAKNDAIELELGTTAAVNQLYTSYCLAKPNFIESTPGTNPEQYAFEKLGSFADLCYDVALAFGCYLRYEWTSPTDLTIRFVSRRDIVKHPLWIKDVTGAELDITPTESQSKDKYYSDANGLAGEGYDTYSFTTGTYSYQASPRKKEQKSGDRLLLSLARTHRRFNDSPKLNHSGIAIIKPEYPHNVLMLEGGSVKYDPPEVANSQGGTTAIYMQATGDGEYGLNGETIWAPVYMIEVEIDGDQLKFSTLSDYVNYLNSRDADFYEAEYTLTVPYLCSFRKSAKGSDPDDDGGRGRWNNLVLGAVITLDGKEFVVVGYTRRGDRPETKLRLHYKSRFAFSAAGTTTAAEESPVIGEQRDSDVLRKHTASGAILAGDYVNVSSIGEVYKTKARHDYFDSPYGVAMNDADSGELVYVQIEGIVGNEDYVFTPGDMVFVRMNASGLNISTTPLAGTDNGSGEDMYLRVGHAVTTNSFKLESPRKIVYLPEFPV